MLADRIAQLRKVYGMNQTQLAQILHISPSTEGMYEQGRRTPSLEILAAMSRLFGVSLDYLITGSEFNPDNTQEKHITCPCHTCRKQGCRQECSALTNGTTLNQDGAVSYFFPRSCHSIK